MAVGFTGRRPTPATGIRKRFRSASSPMPVIGREAGNRIRATRGSRTRTRTGIPGRYRWRTAGMLDRSGTVGGIRVQSGEGRGAMAGYVGRWNRVGSPLAALGTDPAATLAPIPSYRPVASSGGRWRGGLGRKGCSQGWERLPRHKRTPTDI